MGDSVLVVVNVDENLRMKLKWARD